MGFTSKHSKEAERTVDEDMSSEIFENPKEQATSLKKKTTNKNNKKGDEEDNLSDTHSFTDGGESEDSERQRARALTGKESRRVFISKATFWLVLLVAAATVASIVYIYASDQEEEAFRSSFEDVVDEMVKVSEKNAINIHNAYKSTAATLTSFAIGSNSTWPFVTVPLFPLVTEHVVAKLEAAYVSIQVLVTEDQRKDWEDYSVANQWWINESIELRGLKPDNGTILPFISKFDFTTGQLTMDDVPPNPYYAPVWQVAPTSQTTKVFTNYNSFQNPDFGNIYDAVTKYKTAVISRVQDLSGFSETNRRSWPTSTLAEPVFRDSRTGEDGDIVALITALIPWHVYFESILSDGVEGIIMEVRNKDCGQVITYRIEGPEVVFLGPYDNFTNPKYVDMELSAFNTSWQVTEGCDVSLHFYPTDEFENFYKTKQPMYMTIAVGSVFLFTAFAFVIYDWLVERRQKVVLTTAVRSEKIVDSFLPEHVRERVMERGLDLNETKKSNRNVRFTDESLKGGQGPAPLPNIYGADRILEGAKNSKPIADLHPKTTVMMADFANFTAWSSTREPSQIFVLLETVYAEFDKIARRRRVFKVETIGDTYVAVTGLPEPRADHATVMARFARDCLIKMQLVVRKLETMLGPDTADLGMRFGLHSGPVTAGVLRGDRSRFQLFGGTVNTAQFLQNSGAPNRIHVSEDTATLIIEAGRNDWLRKREDPILTKRNEVIKTYWLALGSGSESGMSHSSHIRKTLMDTPLDNKVERLIGWHVDVLSRYLKQIIAARGGYDVVPGHNKLKTTAATIREIEYTTVLDEVQEIITLPNELMVYKMDPSKCQLSQQVMSQLYNFVSTIAHMYRDNSFHCFEHASHVAQSLSKFLSRVVTSDKIDYQDMKYVKKETGELHEFTYGLASDPLTHFACVFSALIHDVDHRGVPNSVLIQEDEDMATMYKQKSVAEQNSVDLAWELLMESDFKDLREVIYSNQAELDRFRQLVANSVMATDIVDKELGALRKNRWNKAFAVDQSAFQEPRELEINRKATIVIEHLIQAADVAHTMQHWNVYLKWNERFFRENYQAYLDGRLPDDPSVGWYKGELGFFDFYIIPLAKKLASCGVFGVSSDECLDYAEANRREWESKGEDVVKGYLSYFQSQRTASETV